MEDENSLQTPFCEGKIIYFLFPNNNREVINKLMFLFSGHRSGYFLTQQVPIQKSSLNGLKSCFNARSQKSMTLILTSNVNVNVYLTFFWTKFAHSAMLFGDGFEVQILWKQKKAASNKYNHTFSLLLWCYTKQKIEERSRVEVKISWLCAYNSRKVHLKRHFKGERLIFIDTVHATRPKISPLNLIMSF